MQGTYTRCKEFLIFEKMWRTLSSGTLPETEMHLLVATLPETIVCDSVLFDLSNQKGCHGGVVGTP